MTLEEKYYALNKEVDRFLLSQPGSGRIFKYGTVQEEGKKYPYFQSIYRFKRSQPFASSTSGRVTEFEYDLNFFTAAKDERNNDASLFLPLNKVIQSITDPTRMIFRGIANVLHFEDKPEFEFRGGLTVIQRGIVFTLEAVCTLPLVNTSVNSALENSVAVAAGDLNFE